MKQQEVPWWLNFSARRSWRWALVVLGTVVATLLVFQAVHRAQVRDALSEVAARLELVGTALNTELARLELVPELLALDSSLAKALTSPKDPTLLARANRFLQEARRRTDAEAVFLIDIQGLTIASSNHGHSGSFVGENYAFRPYVQDALKGGFGRFYAVGATTGRPGYFLAAAVSDGQTVMGVIAVKVSLEGFASTLLSQQGATLIADEMGAVILSSHPQFLYRLLGAMTQEQRDTAQETKAYGDRQMAELLPGLDLRSISHIEQADGDETLSSNPMVVQRLIEQTGWTIVSLTDTPNARWTAMLAAAATTLMGAGLAMAWQIVALRAQRRRDLQQAEAQIQQRLDAGTLQLRRQLDAQVKTEALLRATTDSAVQAGKLAVLGQMAGAVSHELNQPLTAMRSFSDNAKVLLEKGRLVEVRQNIDRVSSLAERMGQIVAQLSAHLRKQPGPLAPVDVGRAVQNALQLLGTLREERLDVVVDIEPAALAVLAQSVRLEQVLLNLLRNALEAQPSEALPCVTARSDGPSVSIEVRDHGPGIDPRAMDHLFEPFFTTKPQGLGLGLGLAVSLMILRDMGGELTARNRLDGGASFTITLPRVATMQPVPETFDVV
jgi:two-component system C4-dicarboxylate transport sensor histidine kinase DctB